MRHLLALLAAGLLLLASPARSHDILLAEVYRQALDPANYLVSEKLDGVRATWDGQQLRFRSGQPVAVPAWFLAALPAQPLDGELWAGRGQFERVVSTVRKQTPEDAEWRAIRYMIFELPDAPGDFRARAERIRQITRQARRPWLQAVEQFRVADRTELQRRLETVVEAGGEGLMLHRVDAPYLTGRSDALLKLKPWLDAEARVIAHLPGTGRNQKRMGSLLMELPDGRRFRLGSGFTDRERDDPPPVGSLVTYRYQALTAKGLPRHPRFLRERPDGL